MQNKSLIIIFLLIILSMGWSTKARAGFFSCFQCFPKEIDPPSPKQEPPPSFHEIEKALGDTQTEVDFLEKFRHFDLKFNRMKHLHYFCNEKNNDFIVFMGEVIPFFEHLSKTEETLLKMLECEKKEDIKKILKELIENHIITPKDLLLKKILLRNEDFFEIGRIIHGADLTEFDEVVEVFWHSLLEYGFYLAKLAADLNHIKSLKSASIKKSL